jgi:hypothetical protein
LERLNLGSIGQQRLVESRKLIQQLERRSQRIFGACRLTVPLECAVGLRCQLRNLLCVRQSRALAPQCIFLPDLQVCGLDLCYLKSQALTKAGPLARIQLQPLDLVAQAAKLAHTGGKSGSHCHCSGITIEVVNVLCRSKNRQVVGLAVNIDQSRSNSHER